MANTSNNPPKIWNEILDSPLNSPPAILREIKGAPGEWTPLYQRLYRRKGLCVLRTGNRVVFVGISGTGANPAAEPIEGSLADRSWALKDPSHKLNRKLGELGINILDCDLLAFFVEDPQERASIKMDLIDYFRPIGNG